MVRIAVTPSLSDNRKQICCNQDYMEALRRSGAVPVLLPLMTDAAECAGALEGLQGLMVTGGADVHPASYGAEKETLCGETCPERDLMELNLICAALKNNLPLFGICRGMQLINCALGGTLYQDIAAQYHPCLRHPVYERPKDQVHTVAVTPNSLLARIVGSESLAVNSRHHQAVWKLGRNLLVNAVSPDGLIEGIELPGYRFVLGVQWHPESLSDYAAEEQAIFNAFQKACETNG